MFEFLFTLLADPVAVGYPQDAAGGEVLTPSAGPPIPCAVQDLGPAETDGQSRAGSTNRVRVFLAADPGLKAKDQLRIFTPARAFLYAVRLDGPAFDNSGQAGGPLGFAAAWELSGTVTR